MKSYLDLAKNYEKVHKKRNRITIICIVIAVSLVTAIFGMADMEAQAQKIREINEHGNWHFCIKNPDKTKINEIKDKYRGKIAESGYLLGFYSTHKWKYNESEFRLTGGDEGMLANFGLHATEGKYPSDKNEIMIDMQAAQELGIKPGDSMEFALDETQNRTFTVSGTYDNTAFMLQSDMHGVVMLPVLSEELFDNTIVRAPYYICLKENFSMHATIDAIKSEFGFSDEDISENTALLALCGQSDDSYMLQLYGVAAALFVLVLFAGIMMISGTFNTNVEERTQFFGMLRCLGATKQQIRRYVFIESIRYLRKSLPIGVAIGILTYWVACAYLKIVNYEYFAEMPVFRLSPISVISGILVGFFTVLFAALAPCRRASKVSPLSAVTSNQYSTGLRMTRSAKTKIFKVENALGVHHATSNKKSLLLMTGSFAMSIILFLSFSVVVSFMNHALVPMEAWTPDIEFGNESFSNTIAPELVEQLRVIEGVKKIYGRKFVEGTIKMGDTSGNTTLLSYEENQFAWARKYLVEGSIDDIASGAQKVIVAYNMTYPYEVGEKIELTINGVEKEAEIGAIVNKTPFKTDLEDTILITNESYFASFADAKGYAVVDIQLKRKKQDQTVEKIKQAIGDVSYFSDSRLSNSQVKAANGSFSIFIYGFLAIIALITVFNIINSMNMSINARLSQYGVMHAIGMSAAQIKKMVLTEAVTYATSGYVLGAVLGMLINQKLFSMMITFRWGSKWSIPWSPLAVIGIIVIGSTIISVLGPMKKCKDYKLVNNG